MKRFAIATLFILLLTGCIKMVTPEDYFRYNLVVDGRIEQGRAAIVMLSQNMPYTEMYNEDMFRDLVVRWATVTIIHDGEEEVLTGRSNDDYPTKYIYYGKDILGEVGESYTIRVEYSNQLWESTTTILEPIELYDIEVVAVDDKYCTIEATLPPSPHPCSIDCSLYGSTYYAPTLLGTYAPSQKMRRITINRPTDRLIREDYTTLFSNSDRISLRVNTLCDFSYSYWRKWEDNFINSINPIFPSTSNLPTNISNNGQGIWAGYGTSYHKVQMTTDSEL